MESVLLLTPWHVAHLPLLAHVPHHSWDSFRLLEAAQLRKAFSLVSVDSLGGRLRVSMHPLIHAWARDRQDDRQRHGSWLHVRSLMTGGSKDGVVWRQHELQVQSHMEVLVGWEVEVVFAEQSAVMVARILANIGGILHQLRNDTILFVLLGNIFARLHMDRLDVDGRWLGVYDLAGRDLVNYGKDREAVSMMEKVLKIREQSLAEDHSSRLASHHAMAGAYEANGQVKEAVALLKQVVKIEGQTLAEDHPDRLASQHNLAF